MAFAALQTDKMTVARMCEWQQIAQFKRPQTGAGLARAAAPADADHRRSGFRSQTRFPVRNAGCGRYKIAAMCRKIRGPATQMLRQAADRNLSVQRLMALQPGAIIDTRPALDLDVRKGTRKQACQSRIALKHYTGGAARDFRQT